MLSGPGLHNIYSFLFKTRRGEEPVGGASFHQQDSGALITEAALEGTSALCVVALRIFVDVYGAEAANLVLKVKATGGIYLGGGIAQRIIDHLKGAAFMKAVVAKGRMGPLLEAVPIRVVMNDRTGLYGAARIAQFGVKSDQPSLRSCGAGPRSG